MTNILKPSAQRSQHAYVVRNLPNVHSRSCADSLVEALMNNNDNFTAGAEPDGRGIVKAGLQSGSSVGVKRAFRAGEKVKVSDGLTGVEVVPEEEEEGYASTSKTSGSQTMVLPTLVVTSPRKVMKRGTERQLRIKRSRR